MTITSLTMPISPAQRNWIVLLSVGWKNVSLTFTMTHAGLPVTGGGIKMVRRVLVSGKRGCTSGLLLWGEKQHPNPTIKRPKWAQPLSPSFCSKFIVFSHVFAELFSSFKN
jgi:hypothetical protein